MRTKRQIQDRFYQILFKEKLFRIHTICGFMHVAVLDMNTIKIINDVFITNRRTNHLIQVSATSRPQHSLIMITDNISQRVARFRRKLAQSFKDVTVTFHDFSQNFESHLLCNHGQNMTFVITLQEV
ncbi:hypothetical protein D3C87_1163260 [compost metagenome]